jgi:hypothetical protein
MSMSTVNVHEFNTMSLQHAHVRSVRKNVDRRKFLRRLIMSSIVLANEYTKLPSFAKGWAVKPKPPKLGIERQLKGHVTVKHGHSYLTDEVSTVTYDNPEEMLKGMHQATDKKLEAYRMPGQEHLKNSERQYGNGMWSRDLVAAVCKLNPNLWVEDSINVPGCAGFYKMVGETKVAAGSPNASFRHGFMPEGTVCKADKADLLVEFVYGWRQVLVRLRKSGDLNERQFRSIYGYIPYSDDRGQRFASDLGEFRA